MSCKCLFVRLLQSADSRGLELLLKAPSSSQRSATVAETIEMTMTATTTSRFLLASSFKVQK